MVARKKTAKKRAQRKTTPRKASSAGKGRKSRGAPKERALDRQRAKSVEELPTAELLKARPQDLHEVDVESALASGDARFRGHLEELFGEALLSELQGLARDAHRVSLRGIPDALILPGIMGSKLGFERWPIDDTIWVDLLDIARGNLLQLAPGKKPVVVLGAVLLYYLKMKLMLRLLGVNASFAAFDWRLDVRTQGEVLAQRIRKDFGPQGVVLIGHSMGGLVARSALQVLRKTKDDDRVRRIILLGTPSHGSFVPVTVLRKGHALTKKLGKIDLVNSLDELIDGLFSRLPGLMQLLPPPERTPGLDLLDARQWPSGPKPQQEALALARGFAKDLALDASKMALIAGLGRPTLAAARVLEEGFEFQSNDAGDGVVPLAFALLPNVPTYFTRAQHGDMPNDSGVINAVADLVKRGQTSALPTTPFAHGTGTTTVPESDLAKRVVSFGGRRGSQVTPAEFRELFEGLLNVPRPTPMAVAAPTGTAESGSWKSLSGEPIEISRKRQHALDVRVAYGDIAQIDARAILLGVFSGVEPSGAAKSLDRHLSGGIRDLVEHGLVRGDMGQIFILPTSRQHLRAEYVVFVGLGEVDRFDDGARRTVARNAAHALANARLDDVATVLLGGGSGLDAGAVIASMVEGFLEALRTADDREYVRRVTFCEFNRARYDDALASLRVMLTAPVFDDVRVTFSSMELPPSVLPPLEWREAQHPPIADPIYLLVRQEPETSGGAITDVLHLSLLTADGGATVLLGQAEFKEEALETRLKTLASASATGPLATERAALAELGRWISRDILSAEIRAGLRASKGRHLVVVHDSPSSRVPWEALEIDGWVFALDGGVSRKLALSDQPVGRWLASRPLGANLHVLLVVNPTEDLPGADKEGQQVLEALRGISSIKVTTLHTSQATRARIRDELKTGRYDVFHFAGHAFYDPTQRERSGILCHGSDTLTGTDLLGIESLPAVAIINACESGRVRRKALPKGVARSPKTPVVRIADTPERVRVKTSLAEAFLRGGIAAYIGTYWPVGDAPALEFAKSFYGKLLLGETVASALIAGREAISKTSVDWADYIHYGTRTLRLLRPDPTPP